MLSILESLLPVTFGLCAKSVVACHGRLAATPAAAGADIEGLNISSLTVQWDERSSRAEATSKINVKFSDDQHVPFPFRGVSVDATVAARPSALVPKPAERVLAVCGSAPVWVLDIRQGVKHYRSGFGLPEIPHDGGLTDVLRPDRFIEVLILLHWLREISQETRYQGPPLRACFMFDDPNLHWPRYGFVDFKQIAQHALRGHYHVSFATIPLDTWFTHGGVAEIFRTNACQMSLLVHGNNHTWLELARRRSEESRLGLLTQARMRVQSFERRTGIPVARVMVPPGGACSEETLIDLPGCGFEAACISHGSLRVFNKGRSWTRSLGYHPGELILGCPVLPRWALSREKSAVNTVLLAAFLNQPIILRGHHGDLKDGIGLLDEMGKLINGLGSVLWSDLTGLSRCNYSWRMDGHALRVKPYGRRLLVERAAGANELIVEADAAGDRRRWRAEGVAGGSLTITAGESVELLNDSAAGVSLEVIAEEQKLKRITEPRFAALPVLRRVLTEGRDRWLS
jgi:hypothetical protein